MASNEVLREGDKFHFMRLETSFREKKGIYFEPPLMPASSR